MKLHLQAKLRKQAMEAVQEKAQTFLDYLQSPKFKGEDDWVRTWEVENFAREVQQELERWEEQV